MSWIATRRLARDLPAGILAGRREAHAALQRMFARGRRQQTALTLVRIGWSRPPNSAALPILLAQVAADLRITDLCWWEAAAGALLVLLEATGDAEALLRRWRARAQALGLDCQAAPVTFPRQGVTLGALLELLP